MSELVTNYLERAVTRRLWLDMWWHLRRCRACRQYYDQMRRTVGLLHNGPPPSIESGRDERIVAELRRNQHGSE